MGRYVLKRVLLAIPQLGLISIILFVIMNNIGDPLAIQMSSQRPPTGEELQVMRRRMGLDKPIYLQYVYWLIGNDWTTVDASGTGNPETFVQGQRKGILRGDLGTSLTTHQPTQQRIAERLALISAAALNRYVRSSAYSPGPAWASCSLKALERPTIRC